MENIYCDVLYDYVVVSVFEINVSYCHCQSYVRSASELLNDGTHSLLTVQGCANDVSMY